MILVIHGQDNSCVKMNFEQEYTRTRFRPRLVHSRRNDWKQKGAGRMAAIRAGVVGFGLAGQVFHAPMIDAVDGLELAAVVERSRREAETRYPGIRTCSSLEAMLEDKSLELIVIATPNHAHASLAKQALAAGRHVVVDKPVGNSSEEIAAMMAAARANGRKLIPYHNRRFDGDFMTLRGLLREQALGNVVHFESTFDRWRPTPKPEVWRDAGGAGTGTLLDLGTHLVDQIVQLFGLPEAVSAEVLAERANARAVDSFTVRMHYPGLVATASANCLSAQPRPRYRARGNKGDFVKWGLDPQEERLRANGSKVTNDLGVEAESAWGVLAVERNGEVRKQSIATVAGDYRLYYAGVRDALLGIAAPPVTALEAWRVARILEMAEESARAQRWVECDWTNEPTAL